MICRNGQMTSGHVTVTLDKGETTVIFRNVPAFVCDMCGQSEVDDKVADRLLKRLQEAAAKGTEIEILQYAA